ncbi:MAG: hypothetical protein AAFP08_09250 [Bacteroidota bacterium]
MKSANQLWRAIRNVQILSALIWAMAIILCSWLSDKEYLSSILITAAGFHVVLLAQADKRKTCG